MTKDITLDDMMSRLPPDEQQAIKARAAQIQAEYATLKALRRMAGLTQARVSKELDVPQSNISRLESNADMLLSTLRGYVEAVGGKLNLTVEMPDQPPIQLTGLGDLVDDRAGNRPVQ